MRAADAIAATLGEQHQPLMNMLHSVSVAPMLGAAIFQKAASVFTSDDSLRTFARLDKNALKMVVETCTPDLVEELVKQTQKLSRSYDTMDANAKLKAMSSGSKFSGTTLIVGSVHDFHSGLLGRLGQAPNLDFEKAMTLEHCQRPDSNDLFTTSNYKICTTPALEWKYAVDGLKPPDEQMCHGRIIRPIEELMQLDIVRKAKLQRIEVISVSLYTGPMFMKYNPCLRQGTTDGRNMYATTIFVLVSAVQKIARVTQIYEELMLYCGLGNVSDLPDSFLQPDALGSKGWTEFGFRSTTADKSVALDYSGIKNGNPHPMVIAIKPNAVDRGACIAELSQYPGEREYLFVPCSFLQPNGPTAIEVVPEGIVKVVPVHLSLNLKTETIEEIVSKKRDVHFSSFGGLLEELARDLKEIVETQSLCDTRQKQLLKEQWKAYTAEVMLDNIKDQCKQVYDRQKSEDIAAFTDDFRFRNLVTEMLNVKAMAKSKLLVWMHDDSLQSSDAYAYDLQFCHRRWISLLRSRITSAGRDSAQSRKFACEYLLTKGLISESDFSKPVNGELPVTLAACEGWFYEDVHALCAAGGFIPSGLPVYWASYYGHLQTLSAFLKNGGNANEERTYTLKYIDKECIYTELPMHVAAQTGQQECLRILAQHGGDVHLLDNYDRDALHFAAGHSTIECVKILLDLGADPFYDGDRGAKQGAFWYVCFQGRADALSLFLDRFKAIPSRHTSWALWRAARNGHAKCVELLLLARADFNVSFNSMTPLEAARKLGHTSCVNLLQNAT
jgi:hypothetical protein